MREEIIKRNTITTVIVLIIFFILSILINANAIRKNVEASIVASSQTISNRLNELNVDDSDDKYIDIVKEHSNNDWIKIVLAKSDGLYLYDSTNDIDYDYYNIKLDESDISLASSTLSDKKRTYAKDNMLYYVVKINNGMILKTSVALNNDYTFVLYNVFYLLILIALVLTIEIISSRKINLIFTESFDSITKNLKSISEGNYELFDTSSKYKEVHDALTDIDKINRNIYKSIQNVSIERDKISFIVNNMHQGMFILDLNKKVLLANDYAISRLNLENLFSNNLDTVYFNQIFDNEEIDKCIDSIIADPILTLNGDLHLDYFTKQNSRIYEFRMSYIDGKWDEKSENGLIFIFVINVTKQRKEDEAKTDFIANVSHELKTPITSINGFSELLLSGLGETDDTAKSYIERIHDESEYMKKTIEELLYLSNLEYEKNTSDLDEIVDLDVLVKECVSYYDGKHLTNDVTVSSSVFPVTIKGSSPLLRHLINNLIENAIKYNKPSGKVEVRLKNIDDNFVYLEVADTGIGIDAQNYDNIFDRFYRVDQSRNRRTGGVGLGLAICKRISDAHHTKIEIESKLGIGTTFKIKFAKIKETQE